MSYSGRRLRADPFTDLLFNVLLSFTLLMFLAIIFMNPIPSNKNSPMQEFCKKVSPNGILTKETNCPKHIKVVEIL